MPSHVEVLVKAYHEGICSHLWLPLLGILNITFVEGVQHFFVIKKLFRRLSVPVVAQTQMSLKVKFMLLLVWLLWLATKKPRHALLSFWVPKDKHQFSLNPVQASLLTNRGIMRSECLKPAKGKEMYCRVLWVCKVFLNNYFKIFIYFYFTCTSVLFISM